MMQLDDHAEELASDLGVDKEEVKRDLQNLVEYSVPIEEAKSSLRRKHGSGSDGSASAPTSKDVAEITTDDSSVTVTVRVLTNGKRSIRYQGEEMVIQEGEMADATGTVSYTAWQDFGFEAGDSITVGNAGVREWDGEPELNLNESTTVAIADEVPVDQQVGGDRQLIELQPGDRGRNVEVRVLEVERKTIDGRDGETEILSGVLGDETARLPFTDWEPHEVVEEGESIRLEDVHVREFRGSPSVNISEFTDVRVLDRDIDIADAAPRLSVGDAVDSGGMFDVEVVGNVLDVRDGSGLIERCSECGRVVQNGQCRSHGEVEVEDDLRVKAILDDGTGAVTAVLDRGLTEDIYGGSLDDAKEAAREAMNKEIVAETIAEQIVGRAYRVRGTLSVDDYGANLDASTFEPLSDDPAAAAHELFVAAQEDVATDGGLDLRGTASHEGGDRR